MTLRSWFVLHFKKFQLVKGAIILVLINSCTNDQLSIFIIVVNEKLTAATVKRSNTLQQYLQALAFPYFDWHSSKKITKTACYRFSTLHYSNQWKYIHLRICWSQHISTWEFIKWVNLSGKCETMAGVMCNRLASYSRREQYYYIYVVTVIVPHTTEYEDKYLHCYHHEWHSSSNPNCM